MTRKRNKISTPTEKIKQLEALFLKGKVLTLMDIAEELSIEIRSAFRYLLRLEKMGHTIQSGLRSQSRTKDYWIDGQQKSIPVSLVERLRKMDIDLTLGGTRKYHKLLLETIEFCDPNKEVTSTQSSLGEIEPYFHVDHGPLSEQIPATGKRDQIIDHLLEAIRFQHVLQIHYLHAGQSQSTLLLCEPYFLSLRVGKLYLLCRVLEKDSNDSMQILVFRRIRMITKTNKVFTRNSKLLADDFYQHCFGQWVPRQKEKVETITLRPISTWTKDFLSETHFDPPLRFNEEGDAMIQLYLTPDLENWILGLLPDVQLLGPETLKKKLRQRIQKISQNL